MSNNIDWNNKEVVLTAVAENGQTLGYASEELKNGKVVALTAIQNIATDDFSSSDQVYGWILDNVSKELRKDKELIVTLENTTKELEFGLEAI